MDGRSLLGLALLALAGGCASDHRTERSARPVHLAEFAAHAATGSEHERPRVQPEPEPVSAEPQVPSAPPGSPSGIRLGAGDLDPDDVRALAAAVAVEPGVPIVVDSLVGLVNGRPIFADEFFEPIEDRLVAEAEGLSLRAYAVKAAEIIGTTLREVVRAELVLAEAEASLTPEEQQGLFAWLRSVQEQIVSQQGGGTRSSAEERLRETEGQGLEDYVGTVRDTALMRKLIAERIENRVVVSWRDVVREYQRRHKDFNPQPTVSLSRIRLSTRDAAGLEEVRRRLAAGEPFAAVAEVAGMPDGGAWQELPMGPLGPADVELSEQFRAPLAGLSVGQTSAPFEVGTSTWWLHLAAVNEPTVHSLYDFDVQRALANAVRVQRLGEEHHRFINSLMRGGIFEELQVMADQLLELALARYGPS